MQRKTNTTRIEATNVLGYMLIVAWVPYGISKLLKFVAWEYHIHNLRLYTNNLSQKGQKVRKVRQIFPIQTHIRC